MSCNASALGKRLRYMLTVHDVQMARCTSTASAKATECPTLQSHIDLSVRVLQLGKHEITCNLVQTSCRHTASTAAQMAMCVILLHDASMHHLSRHVLANQIIKHDPQQTCKHCNQSHHHCPAPESCPLRACICSLNDRTPENRPVGLCLGAKPAAAATPSL